MAERPGGSPAYRDLVAEPSSFGADAARYAFAAAVVIGAGAAWWTGRPANSREEATEIDSAITVDLPPAEASSRPASDAAEGPEQQAAQASVAQAAPERQTPPKPDAEPAEAPEPVEQPPPPARPDPPAVLERKQDEVVQPAVAAPPAAAQEERAPAGSQAPADAGSDNNSEERPHASAHAITVWQKALLRRLEGAKRTLGVGAAPAGVARIAFAIDARGALTSERVATSSGSPSLDRAALLLVRQAAPFPAPPSGSGGRDTSFIVPIRFR